LPKGHNYEVAWVLRMCVEFNIKLKNKMAEQVFASNDYVSILIALDLKSRGRINALVSTDGLLTELTEEFLMNENWLFTYESIKKGWLTPTDNPIDENKYFKILLANGIYFYKEDAKVKTFTVKKPTEEINEITKKPETEVAKTIVSGGGGSSY